MARKASKKRVAKLARKTKETSIELSLALDGTGKTRIATTIPFFDHMLELLAVHGLFDLTLKAKGDTDVDDHHLVEDVGIVLGKALAGALGDKQGIVRYGSATVPMDEALATGVVDLSGRPYLRYAVELSSKKIKQFEVQLLEEFLRAFAFNSQMTLHVMLEAGRNTHHCVEAVFKAIGRALDAATRLDPRRAGVPSSKGML
ncbi:MAG: imidazoleglycerol-phosphate dehydratase HisB [Verrucomicrobia bacterium]|nr:imidazoleglycerol-phosphate dehydratase HisB [Verrucomicrobiota bacterium]